MKNLPKIFQFGIVSLGMYLILTLLIFISPVRKVAVTFYNTFQQATFNTFHPTTRTDFRLYEGDSPNYDYSVYIFGTNEWKSSRDKKSLHPLFILNQNARTTALGPFILLLSLIIASPINYKRKILSFIIGGLLVYFILSMKYTSMIDENAVVLRPEGWSTWVSISKLLNNAFRTQEFLLLMIIPIWAISSLRKQDMKWFLT